MSNPIYGMNFGTDAMHHPAYTTTQDRLQVNLNNNSAKQFDVRQFGGGTNFSINLAVPQTINEQLLVINHNLGYKPQVYAVFALLPIGTPANASTLLYSEEQAILAEGGAATDSIGYTIDKTNLTIFHNLICDGSGTGSFTSTAANFTVQLKYLICNNKHIRTTKLF